MNLEDNNNKSTFRQIKREELKREHPDKLKDFLEKEKKKRQIKREELNPDKLKDLLEKEKKKDK
jgi:hypothetical protein